MNGLLQIMLYLFTLIILVKPLGSYMARVYEGAPFWAERIIGPIENLIYHVCGIRKDQEMTWQSYAKAVVWFSIFSFIMLYLLQRFQAMLPLNPQNMSAVSPDSSFNTAMSFMTNTNWQGYGGEITMSYLTQMLGLGVQNFVSAAAGISALIALIRGFTRHSSKTIGNFWVDLTRTTLYILLPLSFVLAVALVSQGAVQNFESYKTAGFVQNQQILPMGPAASQIAIKQLGTNGGGFFNVNSAHPFENPTPLSNFMEMLAILLIPASLCYTFGRMVKDTRQGWALLAAMFIIFIPFVFLNYYFEQHGNPHLELIGIDQSKGNMEGKEVRFGVANSALWATATAAASNGSVNSMHDSFSPLGGLIPMLLIQLGEIVFGGAGSGLYGMIVFAVIAVFTAGLMVGRTPEYLGKKIEAFEMKMASIVILIPAAIVLIGSATAVISKAGTEGILNPGAHGFSEILYAFSSAGNNNGSAFAGLSANTPFYNILLSIGMLLGRFGVMIPALAIAGSLAFKKQAPISVGTLPTHTPLFVFLLVAIIILVGALTFLPALSLGPIAEHMQMYSKMEGLK